MSFHYSRALADSLSVDNLDGDPYALSSSIYMLVRSSWPDKRRARLARRARVITTSGKARIALRRNGPRTIDKGIVVCVCKCRCKRLVSSLSAGVLARNEGKAKCRSAACRAR